MQIDWDKTIEDILAEKASCPRCGSFSESLVAGYTREHWGADYAPRCHFCNRKDECDARKLVVLCEGCALELHLRARKVDQPELMAMVLNDCRKELEECLDYLAEYWQEDLNVPAEAPETRLEDYDLSAFEEEKSARERLEEEYLTYHRWFRGRRLPVPDPAWRAEYVEEMVALGYATLLGD